MKITKNELIFLLKLLSKEIKIIYSNPDKYKYSSLQSAVNLYLKLNSFLNLYKNNNKIIFDLKEVEKW